MSNNLSIELCQSAATSFLINLNFERRLRINFVTKRRLDEPTTKSVPVGGCSSNQEVN